MLGGQRVSAADVSVEERRTGSIEGERMISKRNLLSWLPKLLLVAYVARDAVTEPAEEVITGIGRGSPLLQPFDMSLRIGLKDGVVSYFHKPSPGREWVHVTHRYKDGVRTTCITDGAGRCL